MEKFVEAGVNALANVVEINESNWFQGHIGASLIAGSFLLKDEKISEEARLALIERLEAIIVKNYEYFSPLKNSTRSSIDILLNSLTKSSKGLSRSGHGLIFGALTLDAIKEFNLSFSEAVIKNISKLVLNCTEDNWKDIMV